MILSRLSSASVFVPLVLTVSLLPAGARAALEDRFIFFPTPDIDATPADRGIAFDEVRIRTDDGVDLHGWFVPGRPGAAALLFFHGNAGNISHRVDNLALFHKLGLNVLIFDYRGYGRSRGRTTEEGTYLDGHAAVAWLADRGWSPERTLFFGRSLGSAVAMKIALDRPPAGLVLESPFTSVADMGRLHYPILSRLLGWLMPARYDTLRRIGALRRPLLILHGDADDVVPYGMGRSLFDAAPEPKTFFRIPGAGHSNTYVVGGAAYWDAWRRFLEQVFGEAP